MNRMTTTIFAAALMFAPAVAVAQEPKGQPVGGENAKQSAPAESSHAAGHDAQSGKPASGEIRNTAPNAGSGQSRDEAMERGGANEKRLDVPPK